MRLPRMLRVMAIPLVAIAILLFVTLKDTRTGTDLIGLFLQVVIVAAIAGLFAILFDRRW